MSQVLFIPHLSQFLKPCPFDGSASTEDVSAFFSQEFMGLFEESTTLQLEEPELKPFFAGGEGYFIERDLKDTSRKNKSSSLGDATPLSPSDDAKSDEPQSYSSISKILEGSEEKDYYKLLGLEKLRWRATPEEIKKAYKKKVLECHPDLIVKSPSDDVSSAFGASEGIKDDSLLFKQLQEAYEIISAPEKRKAYDSTDNYTEAFVDTVPDDDEVNDENFYEVVSPLFEGWGKWSTERNVPMLGNDSSNMKDVEKFYDFFRKHFKSWRVFKLKEEFDLEDAQNRDERRWMEKQIDKQMRAKKAKERTKLLKLIEFAEKNDPRIKKFKAEETARRKKESDEKEQQKRQKEAEKKKEEEEKLRKEKEEADRIKQAKLEERKKKQEDEQKYQDMLKKFRTMCQPLMIDLQDLMKSTSKSNVENSEKIDPRDVEFLCGILNSQQLEEFVTKLSEFEKSNQKDKIVKSVNQVCKKKREVEEEKTKKLQQEYEEAQKLEKLKKIEEEKKNQVAWTTEEMGLLVKALAQFPGGTTDRWEKVAKFVSKSSSTKTLRSPEDVQKKTGEIRKIGQTKGVEGFIPKRDEEEYLDEWKRDRAKHQTAKKKEKEGEIVLDTPTQPQQPVQPAPATMSPAEVAWTNDEQKLFEAALRQFKKDWVQIAKLVPGKTAQDCEKRFEVCKQIALAKKKAA